MTPHIITLGGRRFVLTLGCGIACTFLVWHAKVSDQIFRDIIISTVAAYIAGNVTEKIKAPKADDQ
jgi:hypothetical protein